MLGLGVGGVAVGMFHLIAHAFFKALLFMGAGSVIHGCHEEQDIRRMGGLRRFMPVTFATYAVGMMALCGFPLVFSGFWSKDAILHAAFEWDVSKVPYVLGAFGVLLTAFYMTRQMFYVFFGEPRDIVTSEDTHSHGDHRGHAATPHESPSVMTMPLVVLAVCTVLMSLIGTPAWPWFDSFLDGRVAKFNLGGFDERGIELVIVISTIVLSMGLGLGWWLYGRRPVEPATEMDALERVQPRFFNVLRNAYFVNEFYGATFIRLNGWLAQACAWFDRWVWGGVVRAVSGGVLGLSWVSRQTDTWVVNRGFDEGCRGVASGGGLLSRLQSGRAQSYLRVVGIAFVVLILILIWGGHG
jgi:NADH-quinone oxidoreductase subunit L